MVILYRNKILKSNFWNVNEKMSSFFLIDFIVALLNRTQILKIHCVTFINSIFAERYCKNCILMLIDTIACIHVAPNQRGLALLALFIGKRRQIEV